LEDSTSFTQVPEYLEEIINADDVLSFYTEAKSVTNMAIVFKQYISPSLLFLGGFRTDFTSITSDNIRFQGDKFKINQILIDKYHITLTPVLTIKRFQIVTGIQYTSGRNNDIEQVVNFLEPIKYNPLTRQALEGIIQNNAFASINELTFFLCKYRFN